MQNPTRLRFFIFAVSLLAHFVGQPALAYIDESRPPLEIFSAYKPSYIAFGHPDEKIQFSLKAQVLSAVPLYMGYSQLMMWDFFKYSAPMRDVNYNPFFFYRLNHTLTSWTDFGGEHESNGRDGPSTRSWNRVSIQHSWSNQNLYWSIKAWYPFYFDNTNYDLPRYRGLWEFEVTAADFLGNYFERCDLSFRLYPGGKYYINPFQGGQELIFRTKSKWRSFLPLFVVEFFHGYAENLLDFRNEHYGIRAGIGF